MRGIAKAIIVGTCGAEPEIRQTNSGKKVANFSIATNPKKPNGEEDTQWHRIVCFDKLADIVESIVHKGTRLYAEGRLNHRKYEKDGVERYSTEIVAYDLQVMTTKSEQDAMSGGQSSGNVATAKADDFDDDIPF